MYNWLCMSASCLLHELLLRLISLHMSCIMAASEILHSWIDAGLSYQAMTLPAAFAYKFTS